MCSSTHIFSGSREWNWVEELLVSKEKLINHGRGVSLELGGGKGGRVKGYGDVSSLRPPFQHVSLL